jgi:hypothetical protein
MKQLYHLHECEVDQGDLGSGKAKPTTLGANLRLMFPKVEGVVKKRRVIEGKTKEEVVQESQRLSRWTPIMTSVIAEAILKTEGIAVKIRSWRTHVRQNHYPFRKDCQICQEAAARGRPHLREKLPPKAAVLSLDLAGPMLVADDVGKKKAKYVLWARLPGLQEELEKRLRTKLRKKIQKIKQN